MDGFTMDGDGGFDLDGEPVDLDGDGRAGAYASSADLDGDGIAESLVFEFHHDTDGDGVVDASTTVIDQDADGIADALIYRESADTDGDGRADTDVFVVDSNADGRTDREVIEQHLDTDHDGRVDATVTSIDEDGDGKIDSTIVKQAIDTDGDGTLDTRATLIDTDGDGQIDAQDLDGDGVIDAGAPVHDAQPAAEDAYPDHANFDPSHPGDDVVGDPGADMAHWHEQANPDTCAVVSQEYMLESLTGQEFDEAELRQEAIDHGWYTPGAGTPLNQMGNILEAHGVPVEREYGGTLDDLEGKLEHGQKVLVAIDADETWNAGTDDANDDLLGDAGGIPGQDANHAVEVIGIDRSDPKHPMVILNDPGHPDGRGMMVPADEFVGAWEDSGCYMVSTK
jgi:hypothetical protein